MKANNLNHINYEQLIAALKEESKEKDNIIQLLKVRIYDLTAKSNVEKYIIPQTDISRLIQSINYN